MSRGDARARNPGDAEPTPMKYRPTLRSVRRHGVPAWFDDAKFGIFVHWGLSSVPAYAPRGKGNIAEILAREGSGALFANQPYAEWYLNSLRIEGSPVHRHHLESYGEGFAYERFATLFNDAMKSWDPEGWADLFKYGGARYVVFVTKHHDGFLLWPSRRPNPRIPAYHASRDVVGELTDAVRARGMRMGYYYSGALDWSFTSEPVRDFADLITSGPTGRDYVDYANAHWRELIDTHRPSIMWGDIGYPPGTSLAAIFARYYNMVPDGVVNDRWSQTPASARGVIRSHAGRAITERVACRMFLKGSTSVGAAHHDYSTPEYMALEKTSDRKWECVRGIGRSFGYNREEGPDDYLTVEALVRLLADVVSKNGNLLLNVGPMPDGTIPEVQRERVEGLGRWLSVNGEAIFGTRPWVRAEGRTRDGMDVRYLLKGGVLYAIVLGVPGCEAVIENLEAPRGTKVRLLGDAEELEWSRSGNDTVVGLPAVPGAGPAFSLRFEPAPAC